MAVVVRRGGAQDVRFLRDMLHHAYYWKERQPDAGPGPVQLYVKAWGREGDTAVIALSRRLSGRGRLVSALQGRLARVRLCRPADAGARHRRRSERARQGRRHGAARRAARARPGEGYEAISLSVDRHNKGAIALYEQHGFRQVDETPDSLTLRAELS